MSLESLRFMLGGAIKRPAANNEVVVRHTAEVVCGDQGKIKALPKDRFSGVELKPKASATHPIRVINLTQGWRTQIESGELAVDSVITFKNPAALGSETKPAQNGDHLRIFWEEVITSDTGTETAIEVTISPDTFPGTLTYAIGLH